MGAVNFEFKGTVDFEYKEFIVRIAIIQSGGANFLSVSTALERLGVECCVTLEHDIISAADGILLPGVGCAGFAMQHLHKHNLVDVIKNVKQPLLGICLGMQILYDFSEEGDVAGIGVIPGKVKKFQYSKELIVPHMGWNNLIVKSDNDEDKSLLSSADNILCGLSLTDDVYFVHSYYAPVNNATVAFCNYGVDFTAIVRCNNFYGMQFHPEKSGNVGTKLLDNFVEIIRSNKSQ